MFGLDNVDSVAHVIQVALTPVFLLSGIASILGVLSTRLARVADRVDALAEKLETAGPTERNRLLLRLAYLRRRSHILDVAVMMATLGGAATSTAARSCRSWTAPTSTAITCRARSGRCAMTTRRGAWSRYWATKTILALMSRS